MPGCALPKHLDAYREDAQIHLRRAVAFHKQIFGQAPVGMWPSEGSVSQDIIAPIAECGIEWIATDEEILSESTNGWISRDGQGHLRHPEMLYRPWRVESGDKSLHVIFRDHALSDLIGFHYQRSDPEQAAGDMMGKFLAIGRGVRYQRAYAERQANLVIYSNGAQNGATLSSTGLQTTLKRAGHKLQIVQDGSQLDEALKSGNVDVVLVKSLFAEKGQKQQAEHVERRKARCQNAQNPKSRAGAFRS